MSVLIIGGGIAGFSSAVQLARRTERRIVLLEREHLNFAHASGRNAAIFRPLEEARPIIELARRSAAQLTRLSPKQILLKPTGLALIAPTETQLAQLQRAAELEGVNYSQLNAGELDRRLPLLSGGNCRAGLLLPEGGVLDIHNIAQALRREANRAGVEVHTGVEVRELQRSGARIVGVRTTDGQSWPAQAVVLAAGAWSATLGDTCDASLPLLPYRRHLVQLSHDCARNLAQPVAWDVASGAYLRPESEGVLACPGDHTPSAPGLPRVDNTQLERLAERLPQLAPVLANSQLRRAWACLRTMSPDGNMVVGEDPRIAGLFWLSALGGHGMTTGLAAGELLAKSVLGEADPLLKPLRVERLLAAATLSAESAPSATLVS